jgi:hypothetical protein
MADLGPELDVATRFWKVHPIGAQDEMKVGTDMSLWCSGDRFALTDKQWRKVFEVLGNRSNVVQFQPRTSSSSHRRSHGYRRPSFTRRHSYRLSWREKRFLAALVVPAVIARFQFVAGSKFDAVSVVPSAARNEFASSRFTVRRA